MKRILIPLAVALAAAAPGAWAKAPAGSTGECKDGTYTTSAQKEGACSSHGGVKKWLAKEDKAEKSTKAEKAKAEKAADSAPRVDRPSVAGATNVTKPSDATGECKDGTFTNSTSKSGACSGHKGVKNWYGKDAMSPSAAGSKSAGSTTASGATMSPPASTSKEVTRTSQSASTAASQKTAAAGGGAGQVWVNTDSKVYHCQKDALYGKTKQGEYMSESQAKASGARAARGKECS